MIVKSINVDIWHEFSFKHLILIVLDADGTFWLFNKTEEMLGKSINIDIWHELMLNSVMALDPDCRIWLLNKTEEMDPACEVYKYSNMTWVFI